MDDDRLLRIDKLRELNIGTYLPLPQLVAVGDQSSGKSSLLESVTGIPFPRGQELCTRYATQITHRRDAQLDISVTIIAGPNASPEHKKVVENYERHVKTTKDLQAEFPEILHEVNVCMGVRTDKNPGGSNTFSEDGVTTAKDRDLVRNMVTRYIKDSRTIILAILPCNVDVATQEILSLAEEHDKTGERTLGVLTKPDLVKERSGKAAVCSLVSGERKVLKLGYYVVRNRGGDEEDEDDDLDQREIMFQEEPWCRLPDDRKGIRALRRCLQDLLGSITDQAFPKIRNEIRNMLDDTEKSIQKLGPSRQTEREQQQYLVAVAGRFQSMMRAALDADYSSNAAFESDVELRLITMVVNITSRFNSAFSLSSQTYKFTDDSNTVPDDDAAHNRATLDALNKIDISSFPELKKMLVTDWSTKNPAEGIMEWIANVYQQSRGIELGTFSPAMFASVFHQQSSKWPALAKHIRDVCGERRIADDILAGIMSDLLARYQHGLEQAMLLVEIERERKPYTLNHYFNSNLQKARGKRMQDYLVAKAKHNDNFINTNHVSTVITNKSNAEHAKEEIQETLKAYYKVASKRFVDYVYLQAVDHCLLSGSESPLRLFSEQWVLGLDSDKLAMIAGESRETTGRRDSLMKKVDVLKRAMEIV
ncbi:P-loop containing nucleoside triphosphate hydrolase protein [Podospora fimiseda]|uniref:P-loop containing nucleoside triphosphate hydrolase protein n=1 Tax=Podospora fimiseda TaxID=252190 RepID=A0AAN7BM47_9PEZI|nr:P-loop containing nucleoside triphosphate hydrolase protein [Podospora fimiseda]